MLTALITKITIINNNNKGGSKKLLEAMDMLITLMVVTVSSIYTHRVVYINSVHLFTC